MQNVFLYYIIIYINIIIIKNNISHYYNML
jgi:hypothetical protein